MDVTINNRFGVLLAEKRAREKRSSDVRVRAGSREIMQRNNHHGSDD